VRRRFGNIPRRFSAAGGVPVATWLGLAALAGAVCAGGAASRPTSAPSRPAEKPKFDVTFFVAADTHFGVEGIAARNRKQIRAMNAMPGRAYPRAWGGKVARPRGVLIAGDLTESGKTDEWREFLKHYGSTGSDGLLKFPVYAGTGNHDRHTLLPVQQVLAGVREAHGALTYSWDWDKLHLVCLDLYPDAANRQWLAKDLEKVGKEAPVVLFFHYPLLGPFSDWWKDKDKRAFARTIEGYNVIAVFHGHYHGSEHYRWRGHDVYNVGSPKHAAHSFAVVRVHGHTSMVASWNWDRSRWQWRHWKRIRVGPRKEPATRPTRQQQPEAKAAAPAAASE
jgi:3',5'-cyclic AMP phosphodiesterase CpdA